MRYLTTTRTKLLFASFALGALYVCIAMMSPQSASAAVSCSLSAANSSIPKGSSTTLSWSRSGGGSLVGIDPIGYSSSASSGSTVVSPSSTTTYKLTVDLDSKCVKSVTVTVTTPVTVTCNLTTSATTINSGQSATLSWSSSGGNNWGMSPDIGTVGASGSRSVYPTSTTTYTYIVNFMSPSQCTRSVTITVISATVSCNLTVNTGTIDVGQSVTLSWSSSGGSNWGMSPHIGTVGANGSQSVSPTSTTTYTYIVNMGSANQCMKSVTVTVKSATGASCVKPHRTPIVEESVITTSGSTSITVAAGTQSIGLQYWFGGTVCRTDESPVATSWVLVDRVTIRGPGGTGGTVSGLVNEVPQLNWSWTNGFQTFDTRSFTASPTNGFTQSGTYTITVTGKPLNYFPQENEYICVADAATRVSNSWSIGSCPSRDTTFTINVTVTQPDNPPDCTLTASPQRISRGGSSTLRWSSSRGTSWGFADTTQTIGANGSRTVSPTTTTTYYFLVIGAGGHKTCSVTVVVDDDPPPPPPQGPTCFIAVSPGRINKDESALLTWSSNGATAARVNGLIVNINNSTGTLVSPDVDTTYQMTVYGPGGEASCSLLLRVDDDSSSDTPECTISVNPINAKSGDTITVSWTTNNATEFTLDGVPKTPTNGGSTTYTPTSTTTYKGRVTGADGKSYDCAGTVFFDAVGPYHKVYGGDVSVGGGFGEACTIEQDATILAFNKTAGVNHVGAGTQLAAYALGVINGFGTSQVRTPTSRKQLTFANAVAGDFGGELHQKHVPCIPDYWAGVSRAQTAPNNNSLLNDSGVKKISADKIDLKGKNLAKRERITLYVEGDVRISENITYAGGSYANLADIPSFRLIVKGNIYVDPDVTELNGTFVAMPKDDDSSGKFYTCSPDYRPPSANEVANQCNELLTVYGAVIADTIKFTRSRGTVNDAVVGERYNNNSGRPAEKFIYTPESWLTSDFGGTGDNDSFGSLPPVL